MKQDWKALASLTSDHLGSTVGTVFSAVLTGLLVAVAFIVLYWKLGIFRRTSNKWYNRGVKLWIPFLLIVCITIAAQIGFYRAVYKELIGVNDAVAGAIYERALGPALGSAASRQAFLTSVQSAAKSGQNMGQVITGFIKEALHKKVANDGGITERASVEVADWFIDKYENDIAAAVCYGIYLKAGGHLLSHSSGQPLEYHEFKEGADHLLNLDLSKVELAVQGNIGALTHGLIENQYKGALKGSLLLGILLLLLPVAEWGVYRFLMRKQDRHVASAQADPIVRFEGPPDGPTAE